MWESFIQFTSSEAGKVAVPALIGSIVAILTILLKDIVLHEIRESRRERKEIIHTKLSKLYGPLYTVVFSSDCTLPTFFADDENYKSFIQNQHLLSKELQKLIDECLCMGRGDPRMPTYSTAEMDKVLDITKRFKVQIKKEMDELRLKYG